MKKKIGTGVIILGIIVLCVLANMFVIGEPIDGKQLAYNITEDDSILELQIFAKESAVALRAWSVEQEGSDLFISARKVPVSFLCSSGDYQVSIHTDGIENIYLGGQMIWNSESDHNEK